MNLLLRGLSLLVIGLGLSRRGKPKPVKSTEEQWREALYVLAIFAVGLLIHFCSK